VDAAASRRSPGCRPNAKRQTTGKAATTEPYYGLTPFLDPFDGKAATTEPYYGLTPFHYYQHLHGKGRPSEGRGCSDKQQRSGYSEVAELLTSASVLSVRSALLHRPVGSAYRGPEKTPPDYKQE